MITTTGSPTRTIGCNKTNICKFGKVPKARVCLRNFATTLRVCKIVVLLCNRARIDGSSSGSRNPTAERRLTIVAPCYTKRKNSTLAVRALGNKGGVISTLRCHKMVILGVAAYVPRRGLPWKWLAEPQSQHPWPRSGSHASLPVGWEVSGRALGGPWKAPRRWRAGLKCWTKQPGIPPARGQGARWTLLGAPLTKNVTTHGQCITRDPDLDHAHRGPLSLPWFGPAPSA